MAVETDLNHQREPGLNVVAHQSELPVNKVRVATQAFPSGVDQARPAYPWYGLETLAAFQGPEHTDETLCDPIALRPEARFVVSSDRVALEINERALLLVCHRLSVVLDRLECVVTKRLKSFNIKP